MRQKGYTLLELLIVLAVGSVLMGGIVLSIYQVVWNSARSNSQVVASADINQATLAIKKDLMMTQSSNMSEEVSQSSVALSWDDYTNWAVADNQTTHTSSYTLSGTKLQRTYDGTVSIVGRNITSLEFTLNGSVVTVVITATSPGFPQRSETLTFNVYLRSQ